MTPSLRQSVAALCAVLGVVALPVTTVGATEELDAPTQKPPGSHASHPPVVAAGPSTGAPSAMDLSLERMQSVGVQFEEARTRSVEKSIRTVGRIEIDERHLAKINIKIEGWIDQLRVATTGELVRKGQVLFTLYSPELLATQQEYLLAVQGRQRLGASAFPEVAAGARAALESARRRLELWDIEASHIRDLEATGTILKTLPVHAPIGGTVISKTAVAGMHVSPGDELYTIADLSSVWVIADIYEYELPLIRVGQTADVTLSYAPEARFRGRIGFVYPTVDAQTRTAKVRFELDNRAEILKPGMYANVELAIPLGIRLVVPKDAVLESGTRQIIFVHSGRGRIEWRQAKTGLRGGDWVEILAGLAPGEHIVTSANFLLDSESQLKAAVGGMKGMTH